MLILLNIHPQYFKDSAGKNLAVLSQKKFEKLMEELEELEDIRLFDEAMKKETNSTGRLLKVYGFGSFPSLC